MAVDLSLVPVEDILNEAENRFEDFVFAGREIKGQNVKYRFKGSYIYCAGLSAYLNNLISNTGEEECR